MVDYWHRGYRFNELRLYVDGYLAGLRSANILEPYQLNRLEEEAIRFGYPIAKMVADAEIGQSIAIDRRKAVIAVEAIEGTNKMIERVGRLDIPEAIFIKVSRTRQDFRFDIPTIGITTIEGIRDVKGSVLAVTAEEMLFFQKEAAVALADENDIAVVAVEDAEYTVD